MIHLTVLDKPATVEELQIDDITESTVSLLWKASSVDVGCDLYNYCIQMKTTLSDVWSDCMTTVNTYAKVKTMSQK